MRKIIVAFALFLSLTTFAQNREEKLSYHPIKLNASGQLQPWFCDDPGRAYDHIVRIVWNFWENMRTDPNGLPYYMNHQVWARDHDDHRGIGGDQIAMAMSAWRLLYGYLGDAKLIDNMRFMADYYLTHSLTPADALWPNIPYTYNNFKYSGIYDGDMILGKGFIQPDKAGSFGIELVYLYKMTGTRGKVYLDAAVDIANTLADKTVVGDKDNSPLPYRVNGLTGKVGGIREGTAAELKYSYTSNWSGTLQLFSVLDELKVGNTAQYRKAFRIILDWMKAYPLKNNKWGPFFEDVGEWSDTQINAITFARYILENPSLFENSAKEARSALDWVYKELGNDKWIKFGVQAVNEQTSYRIPGNSHTARQGAAELLYASITGDEVAKARGIRQLNWATYMVNDDGESTYLNNETWMTDGYGDFVRHYMRAFSYFPELIPDDQNHLITTSSVIKKIAYSATQIQYETFDSQAYESFRLTKIPIQVKVEGVQLSQSNQVKEGEYWSWKPLKKGGIVSISHQKSSKVILVF